MLALAAIFLLLLTPVAMVILHLLRPRLDKYQWLIAVLGSFLAWPMVLLVRLNMPHSVTLLVWQPESLFPTSPSLLIDTISWPFALAMVSLSLSLMLTSVARLQPKPPPAPEEPSPEAFEPRPAEGETAPAAPGLAAPSLAVGTPGDRSTAAPPDWRPWAANLALTSLGLTAVLAGNPLALLLAWVALDIVEVLILLTQLQGSASRRQAVVAFAARMGGIAILLLASIWLWANGELLTFGAISSTSSLFLLLAAGLRLGVLPLYLPFMHELPLRRGLGTILRLAPAAASLVLITRTATAGIDSAYTPYLLALVALAAIYGAASWAGAADELAGRPYWILSTASLAVVAAVFGQPQAALAWSLVCIFGGGFIFSYSLRHRRLLVLAGLALLSIATLPFTPAWPGTGIYQWPAAAGQPAAGILVINLSLVLTHALILVGFVRHALRPVTGEYRPARGENWVWIVYTLGLVLLPLAYFGIGWASLPNPAELPLLAWLGGPVASFLALLGWFLLDRALRPGIRGQISSLRRSTSLFSRLSQFFSFNWLYSLLWKGFQGFSRLLALISRILEGEGGLLWAFVILALIVAFLRQTP